MNDKKLFAPICPLCGKVVELTTPIEPDGTVYHSTCLKSVDTIVEMMDADTKDNSRRLFNIMLINEKKYQSAI